MIQTVVNGFRWIPQVGAIYCSELQFWVFTTNDIYDDALMDKLIEAEEAVLEDYELLTFNYPPLVIVANPHEIMPDDAVLIFEKGKDK